MVKPMMPYLPGRAAGDEGSDRWPEARPGPQRAVDNPAMNLRQALTCALTLSLSLGTAGAQAFSAEQRLADLQQLRTDFFARDRAYAPAARVDAEARLKALEAAADVSLASFAVEIARIAALADNGHTLASAATRAGTLNRVPIRLVPFADSAFVVLRARDDLAALLGAELIAIDGVPLQRLREAAHRLAGGPASWRDRYAASFAFESPQQLQALGLTADGEVASYRFRRADSTTVEQRLVAEAAAPRPRQRAGSERWLLPESPVGESGWRSLLDPNAAPWSLQAPSERLRWRALPELKAIQIEMRQTFDAPNRKLADFYAEVRAAIAEQRAQHLLLDLRLNGGGDLTKARDFAESLPGLVAGRIFVLTSPWTFSAAISTAGYLKQAAPERVSIVGEAVGDRLEFFSEGRPVTLKHSGQVLLPATERHDYQGGCRKFSDCHGNVVRRPIAVPTLAPDIAAPWTIEAYRAGRDPALEAVAAALRR
jgi:hypothetical protein